MYMYHTDRITVPKYMYESECRMLFPQTLSYVHDYTIKMAKTALVM